jgi:RNA polymerase sigma-70 factor (ECF subfamily)
MKIEELYERFGPMVHRRCLQLLSCQADAADATQDVFVKLLQRDLGETEGLSSFLYTTATNLCLNRIRDQKRRGEWVQSDSLLVEIASIEDHSSSSIARSLLGKLFGQSLEGSREIAVLHYLDGMSYEEVAQVVGLSVSGVRKRLASLRQSLQTLEAL